MGMLSGSRAGSEPTANEAAIQRHNVLASIQAASDDLEVVESEKEEAYGGAHSVMRREAVLGRDQRVMGYSIMLRRPMSEGGEALPEVQRLYDQALLDNIQRMEIHRLLGLRQAFIPISPSSLHHRSIDTLQPVGTVWELDVAPQLLADSGNMLSRMDELAGRGFRFALHGENANLAGMAPFLERAEFVLIDAGGEDIQHITEQMSAVSKAAAGRRFVATQVQTHEAFQTCHKLQFALFQGPFITRREAWNGPVMNASRAKILDLMNRVRKGAEQAELAGQFKLDPALSVRLLRYVNSPGMGLLNKLGSIDQALMVMGRDKLYRWLTMVLFTGGQATGLDSALLENALVRARLAENLASRLSARARDEVFVVGVFSLLDVVMRTPMEKVLQQISLPAEVTDALLHRRGPYSPYLEIAVACEQDDLARVEALAAQLELDVAGINAAQVEALVWAQQASEA
jgi:EAL and modified HD-GYP domain-containing signal transduction protein